MNSPPNRQVIERALIKLAFAVILYLGLAGAAYASAVHHVLAPWRAVELLLTVTFLALMVALWFVFTRTRRI